MAGGKRPNAGRKRGSLGKKTLEQKAVAEAFNQLILQNANKLFTAQAQIALGSMVVIRVDEEDDGNGKIKRIHTRVSDPDEIIALLNKHDGLPGEVEGSYYFFTDVSPDNKALDSLLNRGLGKPTDKLELAGELTTNVRTFSEAAKKIYESE